MSTAEAISAEEALRRCKTTRLDVEVEEVPVDRSAGRTLATAVQAEIAHPPFDSSAMDGFAVRSEDTPGTLTIAGESRAGVPFDGHLGAGEAVAISTGGVVPIGANAVVKVEDVTVEERVVVVTDPVVRGSCVRPESGDLHPGDVVLPAGARVHPHQIAALAAAGLASVPCFRRMRIAILVTGDEVVSAGSARRMGQVVDASGPGIAAQAIAAGGDVLARARVGDDARATADAIGGLLSPEVGADLLLSVGGVSVGAHDHVPAALEAAGLTEVFRRVEVKPGRPLLLCAGRSQIVLGLPGNPVSAAVCFHVFGRPLLGIDDDWGAAAPLGAPIVPSSSRTELVRCAWRDGALEPLPQQDSHAVSSLAGADALAWIPAGGAALGRGSIVRYSPLSA